jgi:hypothetical protein
MKDFYKFAGEHPFLTFFLVGYGVQLVVGVAKAIFQR